MLLLNICWVQYEQINQLTYELDQLILEQLNLDIILNFQQLSQCEKYFDPPINFIPNRVDIFGNLPEYTRYSHAAKKLNLTNIQINITQLPLQHILQVQQKLETLDNDLIKLSLNSSNILTYESSTLFIKSPINGQILSKDLIFIIGSSNFQEIVNSVSGIYDRIWLFYPDGINIVSLLFKVNYLSYQEFTNIDLDQILINEQQQIQLKKIQEISDYVESIGEALYKQIQSNNDLVKSKSFQTIFTIFEKQLLIIDNQSILTNQNIYIYFFNAHQLSFEQQQLLNSNSNFVVQTITQILETFIQDQKIYQLIVNDTLYRSYPIFENNRYTGFVALSYNINQFSQYDLNKDGFSYISVGQIYNKHLTYIINTFAQFKATNLTTFYPFIPTNQLQNSIFNQIYQQDFQSYSIQFYNQRELPYEYNVNLVGYKYVYQNIIIKSQINVGGILEIRTPYSYKICDSNKMNYTKCYQSQYQCFNKINNIHNTTIDLQNETIYSSIINQSCFLDITLFQSFENIIITYQSIDQLYLLKPFMNLSLGFIEAIDNSIKYIQKGQLQLVQELLKPYSSQNQTISINNLSYYLNFDAKEIYSTFIADQILDQMYEIANFFKKTFQIIEEQNGIKNIVFTYFIQTRQYPYASQILEDVRLQQLSKQQQQFIRQFLMTSNNFIINIQYKQYSLFFPTLDQNQHQQLNFQVDQGIIFATKLIQNLQQANIIISQQLILPQTMQKDKYYCIFNYNLQIVSCNNIENQLLVHDTTIQFMLDIGLAQNNQIDFQFRKSLNIIKINKNFFKLENLENKKYSYSFNKSTNNTQSVIIYAQLDGCLDIQIQIQQLITSQSIIINYPVNINSYKRCTIPLGNKQPAINIQQNRLIELFRIKYLNITSRNINQQNIIRRFIQQDNKYQNKQNYLFLSTFPFLLLIIIFRKKKQQINILENFKDLQEEKYQLVDTIQQQQSYIYSENLSESSENINKLDKQVKLDNFPLITNSFPIFIQDIKYINKLRVLSKNIQKQGLVSPFFPLNLISMTKDSDLVNNQSIQLINLQKLNTIINIKDQFIIFKVRNHNMIIKYGSQILVQLEFNINLQRIILLLQVINNLLIIKLMEISQCNNYRTPFQKIEYMDRHNKYLEQRVILLLKIILLKQILVKTNVYLFLNGCNKNKKCPFQILHSILKQKLTLYMKLYINLIFILRKYKNDFIIICLLLYIKLITNTNPLTLQMYLQVSRLQNTLQVTAFKSQQNFSIQKHQKFDSELQNIFKFENKIVLVFQNEIQVLDSNFNLLSQLPIKLKSSKLALKNNILAIYCNEKVSVYDLQNQFALLYEITTFFPTHIAIFSNILALYFKTKKNQYQLQVIDYLANKQQVFNFRERCKTLQFDFNQELILITKSNKNNYTFQRFYFFEDKIDFDQQLSFDNLEQNSNEEETDTMSPEVRGDDEIFKTGVSRTLSYQFRTCIPDQNIVIAGRFDNYIVMENKKNPLSCIMHCASKINKYYEKLLLDYTKEGHVLVYSSPDQQVLHFIRQFSLQNSIIIKSKDIEKTFFNKTLRIDDIAILQDTSLIVQASNYLLNYGKIAEQVHQKELEMQRFCFDKNMQNILFIYNNVIQVAQIVDNDSVSWFIGRNEFINVSELEINPYIDDEHIEYTFFDESSIVKSFNMKENNRLIITWVDSQEEIKNSIIQMRKLE